MGAAEPVKNVETEDDVDQQTEIHKDLEKQQERDLHMSRMQRLSTTNPLRLVIDNATRVPPTHILNRGSTTNTHHQPPPPPPTTTQSHHPSPPPPIVNPRSIPIPTPTHSTPTPQQSLSTLNSRKYTNKISLFLFILHFLVAICLVFFLVFKGIQGLLEKGSAS